MIDQVLDFLIGQLRTAIPSASADHRVIFPSSQNQDPISFEEGKITVLLINQEEEKIMRPPDPYRVSSPGNSPGGGNQVRLTKPPIRLNLKVLFAARNNTYKEALKNLSSVIAFFQMNPSFHKEDNLPAFPSDAEHFSMELCTLSLSEQNELWGTLRANFTPAVLYTCRMTFFVGTSSAPASTVQEVSIPVIRKNN